MEFQRRMTHSSAEHPIVADKCGEVDQVQHQWRRCQRENERRMMMAWKMKMSCNSSMLADCNALIVNAVVDIDGRYCDWDSDCLSHCAKSLETSVERSDDHLAEDEENCQYMLRMCCADKNVVAMNLTLLMMMVQSLGLCLWLVVLVIAIAIVMVVVALAPLLLLVDRIVDRRSSYCG